MHRGDEGSLRELTGVESAEGNQRLPSADLTPFVPRLIPEWVAEVPDSVHRAIEGTLVFTDLSGFTAMSERLASLGKVGAEELTDHLDAIFSQLITVAGGMGGSMLKFGGDALLILFWRQDHQVRAAWAALEMQRTLDRIGLVATSAGESRLQMTVGAHSGTFDFFLVGTSHRALFVCGPDAAATVRVEAAAEAGEVRLSPDLAGHLDPALLADRSNHYPLLVGAPLLEADVPEVAPWPPGTSAAKFVPAMLRAQLASGIELTEHRQMAVGFLHLSNVDELIIDIGPEATGRHLQDLVTRIQSAFAADDVAFVSTDIYEDGPKIVCATGAVRSFENDEERLLRALREVVDYPSPIDIRVGVNRGHGFCGYVGPSFRRTFAVIGDVVNTAARVMSKAGAGEILATPAVIERSDTVFETVELEPFAAKGKSEPLIAVRVGQISGTRERTQRDLPFVGRQSQMQALELAIFKLRSGQGLVVDVVGEPGIGKTRLVHEVLGAALDVHVAAERCGRYASATPYFPIRTLMADAIGNRTNEEVAELVARTAPELVPYLPLLDLTLGLHLERATEEIEELSGSDRRGKIHEVVAGALRVLVRRPTVWFIDDTHWADSATIELIRHLDGALRDVPLLVCAARRSDGAATSDEIVTVDALADEAAQDLVRSAAGVHLLPQESGRLAERAHGNPLFLIELATAVSQGRDLEQLPDSLEAVLAARIDSLPVSERHVLRQLAVLGGRFARELAEEVVSILPEHGDDTWERLKEFIDTSGAEWQFTQSLVRETAYEGLSFKERRDVHHRAGLSLEQRTRDPLQLCELLSLHFHAANAHPKALDYSDAAGKKAQGAFALAEAAIFYSRCIDAARALADDEALGSALTDLGHMEIDLARYAEAQQHYEESLEIKRSLGNTQGVAAQLSGLGLVARQLGEYDRARSLFEEAVEILKTMPDGKSLSNALRNLGTVSWFQGRYEEAKGSFEEALEEERRNGDEQGIAATLDTLAAVAFALGDLKIARGHVEESLRVHTALGNKPQMALALNNLAGVAFQEGNHDLAREHYEASLELRRELRDRFGIASTLSNLGTIAYFNEQHDVANEQWREALKISREIGDQKGVAQNLHNLSEVADEPIEAMVLCQEALIIRRNLGDLRGVAESLTTMGKLSSQRGNHVTARGRFIEAIGLLQELGNKTGLAECLELIAGTCASAGDAVRAATLLGVVDAMCESMGAARSWASDTRATIESSLREELGTDVYEMTVEVGRSMSLERALQVAQEALGDEPRQEAATA